MAPYTMEINIKNPVVAVNWISSARLPDDGYVTVKGQNCDAGKTTVGATLGKDGGAGGLWIATLFSIAGCLQNLLVWTTMSSASGAEVVVQLAFVDGQDAASLADISYNKPATLGLTNGQAVSKGAQGGTNTQFPSYKATLEQYENKYPNATCTIGVTYTFQPGGKSDEFTPITMPIER